MSTKTKKPILSVGEQRVYDFMLKHKGITTFQANHELGETRLSARIFELKAAGVKIEDEWLNVKNRYKEPRRVKKYYVAGGAR